MPTTKSLYVFRKEDNDNCRVYFMKEYALYCWQDDGSFGRADLAFYVCTSDGEPSYRLTPQITPECPGYTPTGREYNIFIKAS